MMERITTYDASTGAGFIYRWVDMGVEPIIPGEGRDWYRGFLDEGRFYIDVASGEPVEKTEMPVTVEHGHITGIPAGTSAIVRIGRLAEPIDDGVLEIAAAWAETVRVVLQHPHFLPAELEVPCGPA